MNRTRSELDRKITRLQVRAHSMTPRELAKRHLPENFVDYAIGSVITLIGARMAWQRFQTLRDRRSTLRAKLRVMSTW